MISSISKEYAMVLFDMNLDYEYVASNLEIVIKLLKDEEINNFFNHPKIDIKEKKIILQDSLKLEKNELLYFLFVLIDNKRLNIVEDILVSYNELIDSEFNIGRFTVYTSTDLDKNYQRKIIDFLARKYNKKVILDITIDENLIGGIIIKYKNSIIDDSIISRLDTMKKEILNN